MNSNGIYEENLIKKVCVVTGGGSGIGQETAKIMGENGYYIILVGRTLSKLEAAVDELKGYNIESEAFSCDISDKDATEKLAKHALSVGKVSVVIHAAGLSPNMGDPKTILEVNALGTININTAFYEVMQDSGCIIDTSSISAYLTPEFIMPKRAYKLCFNDIDKFMSKMMKRINLFPKKSRSGVAYAISKNFVIWYAKKDAARFGEKDVRVVSITPGNFETPMGKLEEETAGEYLKYNAIKRFGQPKEIAELYAAVADEKMGFLTGTDIICDGGCIASGCSAFRNSPA